MEWNYFIRNLNFIERLHHVGLFYIASHVSYIHPGLTPMGARFLKSLVSRFPALQNLGLPPPRKQKKENKKKRHLTSVQPDEADKTTEMEGGKEGTTPAPAT